MNPAPGIKIGTLGNVEQFFLLDKTGILSGIEGQCFSPGEIAAERVKNLRSVFVLDLPKPHEFLEALESVIPDGVDEFNGLNQQRLKALYDLINSQITIPRIKEPGQGGGIFAQHMELAGAVERLKEEPCAMVHAKFHSNAPWYDLDCKKRFTWSELENPELVQVAE